MRVGVCAVALGGLLVASSCLGIDGAGPQPRGGPDDRGAADVPRTSVERPAPAVPSNVLREWDRARSRAFAQGDLAALRGLYVPGSSAGTSDTRLLGAYLDRGLHVEGMRMQVLALEVLRRTPRVLRLLVTDRLANAVAVGEGHRTALPRDRASTRLVVLRRGDPGGRWRVASVSDSALRPAAR